MSRKLLWYISALLLLSAYNICAQTGTDTKGREFWFTFMPNYHNYRGIDVNMTRSLVSNDKLIIYIAAETPTSGTIEAQDYYGVTYKWNFTITNTNQIYTHTVTNKLFELEGDNYSGLISKYSQNGIVAPQHFVVRAEDDVTVYALNKAQTTSDAAAIFPRDVLGTNYTVVSYNSNGIIQETDNGINDGRTPSQFAIVATENGTIVNIFPTSNVNGTKDRITVNLDSGEVYLVQPDLPYLDVKEDLTGTKIISSKPVAVFAGHQRALVPWNATNVNSRDYLFSQMRPDQTHGKKYIITPFPPTQLNSNNGKDVYRVVALEDNTIVTLNGNFLANLNAGEYVENFLAIAGIIESEKQIIVSQYKGSNTIPNTAGFTYMSDPFMILVPPMKQYLKDYNVTNIQVDTPSQEFSEHFITIICPTAYINTLRINGLDVNPNKFEEIPNTCFSYSMIPQQGGSKKLTCEKPFGVYAYGYGRADSYGYVGGMSFNNEEEIIPKTISNPRVVCGEDTVQMHAQGGESYYWYPNENLSCSDCESPFTLEPKTETYYVEITDRIGCIYLDSVAVESDPQPIASLGEDVMICEGESAQLDAGAEAETYLWSPSAGLSCTDCRYPIASPENTMTYNVKVANGNCFSRDTIKVIANKNPQVSIAGTYEICRGDTAFVNINSNVTDLRWSPDEWIDCTNCLKPKMSPETTTVYYLEAISPDGCITKDSVVIVVNDVPDPTITGDTAICNGELTQLMVPANYSYNWYPSEGLSCTDCQSPVVNINESKKYYCEVGTEAGCVAIDSVTITVNPVPVLETEPLVEVCTDTPSQLNITGAENYIWYPADNLSCDDCPDPIVTTGEDITYTVIGYNEFNCADTAYVEVKIKSCYISVEGDPEFSSVLLCNSGTNFINIHNPNNTNLVIHDIQGSGTDISAFDIDRSILPATIKADSSLKVNVGFHPYKTGKHIAEADIISSADDIGKISLEADAYVTEAKFELKSNIKKIPTDTLTFSIYADCKLLEEVKPTELTAKIKFNPEWLHYTGEIELNNEILRGWEVDAESKVLSTTEAELIFTASGDTAMTENGLLLTFNAIILLSSYLNFTPVLEMSVSDKDLCVVNETTSQAINLDFCVDHLRAVYISKENYDFNTIGNVFDESIAINYQLPFEQSANISVLNSIGEKVLIREVKNSRGSHSMDIDATGLSSGYYMLKFESGPFIGTKKVLIIR